MALLRLNLCLTLQPLGTIHNVSFTLLHIITSYTVYTCRPCTLLLIIFSLHRIIPADTEAWYDHLNKDY